MVEKTEAYKSSDGTLHATEIAAQNHESGQRITAAADTLAALLSPTNGPTGGVSYELRASGHRLELVAALAAMLDALQFPRAFDIDAAERCIKSRIQSHGAADALGYGWKAVRRLRILEALIAPPELRPWIEERIEALRDEIASRSPSHVANCADHGRMDAYSAVYGMLFAAHPPEPAP